MKKILCIFLVCITIFSLVACDEHKNDEVVATVDGVNIYMSDIEQDIAFVSKMANVDMSNQSSVDKMMLDIIETYLLDYLCKMEMEELGITYNKDYYAASYEILIETYGNEERLLNAMAEFGIDKAYLEEQCKKQARRATLSEYVIEEYKKNLDITEEMVLTYYIENSSEFVAEEVRTIYYLSFSDKADATKALEEINSTGFMTYFEAEEEKESTDFYGIMEHCEKGWFPTSIGNILFNLPVGTHYPDLLATFQNAHYTIMYVHESISDYKFTYDEMKESIKEALTENAVDQYMLTFFDNLNKKHAIEVLYGQ